jgi:hypothetical protein
MVEVERERSSRHKEVSDVLKRFALAPLFALLMVFSVVGAAGAGPSGNQWGEVSGEAYFVLEDSSVLQEIRQRGPSGWFKDEVYLPASGYLALPTGTVEMQSGITIRRLFDQEFLAYLVALDEGDFEAMTEHGDWDGVYVGTQTLTFDDVTCRGPVVGRFVPGFQSPGRSTLRCDDGSRLFLHYEGSSELYGAGFDDISGVIRR